MIRVLITRLPHRIPDALWQGLLETLPQSIREEVPRYRRWQDRQALVAGRLLLRKCLSRFASSRDWPGLLEAGDFGRPHVPGAVDFNISHSGDITLCAATDQGRIGIDVEALRPVKPTAFRSCMTGDELARLSAEPDPTRAFFQIWTRKEAVLKADGRGLLAPMKEVLIRGDEAEFEGRRWFLRELDPGPIHVCHLASDVRPEELVIEEMELEALS